MSSSSSATPPAPAQSEEQQQQIPKTYRPAIYNTALAITIAAPIAVLLPPRRLDLSTFGLGIAFFMCSSIVVDQHTGKGTLWHIGMNLPTQRNRQRWAVEAQTRTQAQGHATGAASSDRTGELMQRELALRAQTAQSQASLDGKDAWIDARRRREEEVFAQGGGYGDLIMEQIREVFGIKSADAEADADSDANASGSVALDKRQD